MRRLAFGVVVVALGAVLLLVGLRSSHPTLSKTPTARSARVAADSDRRLRGRGRPPVGARRQARRFVVAFLSYEVGGGAETNAAIRRDSSPAFADQLLSHPPVPPYGPPPSPARIARMCVDLVPGHPDLALASGEARRPAAPEPFAFLFGRRRDHWLAVAPGE